MSNTRRYFLKALLVFWGLLAILPVQWFRAKKATANTALNSQPQKPPLGVEADGFSRVIRVQNGTPEANVRKAVDMAGGIDALVGPTDIVVLKPNAQWWNQGTTNTDAMKGFIELVLNRPGFSGEIIIAENHQYAEDNSRGWNTQQRNGRFNLNELVDYFQDIGYPNVTKYHWRVGSSTESPLEGDAQGDRVVQGPEEGDGYVWMKEGYYRAPSGRTCLMTYPVFTSSHSGIRIDLRRGPWKDGHYLTDRKLRFINFSALNHHSYYCGVTASVKNLMGVVDMSCGWPGDHPAGHYNTHHIGVSRLKAMQNGRLVWRLTKVNRIAHRFYRNFHHTGGVLGHWMKQVRMPDLHIITAEWVGWGSRVDNDRSYRPRMILAGRDPVALDYIAARDVVLPATPEGGTASAEDNYKQLNDPDIAGGPLDRFLRETARQGIGNYDKRKIRIETYDFLTADHVEGNHANQS